MQWAVTPPSVVSSVGSSPTLTTKIMENNTEPSDILTKLRNRYEVKGHVTSVKISKRFGIGLIIEIISDDLKEDIADSIIKDAKPYPVYFYSKTSSAGEDTTFTQ